MATDPWAAFKTGSAPTATVDASDPWAQFRAAPATPAAPEMPTFHSGEDLAKSGGIGVAKGTIGLAGLPGDIGSMYKAAADKIGIPQGVQDTIRSATKALPLIGSLSGPTSQDIQKRVEGVTGEFYKPKSTLGEYAQTTGEFLPAAVAGPGSLARRVGMQALVPAVGSQFAGDQAKGTEYEPYAKVAGALVAPVAASTAARSLPNIVGGLGTHTGGDSIRTAYRSGVKGGESGAAFRENLRGQAPLEGVVSDAKAAVSNMRADKSKNYNAGMGDTRADSTVLDFANIDSAVAKANSVKNYKGQDISKKTAGVRKEIDDEIANWKALEPKEFHTAEGLDALKQSIGDIRDAQPFNTPQRVVADQVYSAIRKTIVDQVPSYAKTMKGYEAASTQIGEIEKTLSLGRKATTDTALRKLQSVTRNNANTNYGKRADLAEILAQNGAPQLMEKLAGQANNTWLPRGLWKLAATGMAGSAYLNPLALAALPAMSPRLVAEVAHALGRGVGAVSGKSRALPVNTEGRNRAGLIASLLAANQ